jgi:hypothetical protein
LAEITEQCAASDSDKKKENQPQHLSPGWPIPSLSRIFSAGQKPVKADWMKFAPSL